MIAATAKRHTVARELLAEGGTRGKTPSEKWIEVEMRPRPAMTLPLPK